MLSIVTWLWTPNGAPAKFSAAHVNTLRSMLARHLHVDHRLYCFTDVMESTKGLDGDIAPLPITEFHDSLRCRRRMFQYGAHMSHLVGPRFLALDLDIVITDDVTPLFTHPDPLVLWYVTYAKVLSGSVQLMNTGILDGLYRLYKFNQEALPRDAAPRGIGSDQAMLNFYLQHCEKIAYRALDEQDGIFTFFGDGYERFAHYGVSPASTHLPAHCRMVILGSDDLPYLSMPILAEHYR